MYACKKCCNDFNSNALLYTACVHTKSVQTVLKAINCCIPHGDYKFIFTFKYPHAVKLIC